MPKFTTRQRVKTNDNKTGIIAAYSGYDELYFVDWDADPLKLPQFKCGMYYHEHELVAV